jgi:hypothetical protein
LVVRKDDATVVLASRNVKTVIDYVLRVDKSRGQDPIDSLNGFVEVVTAGWGAGKSVGEFSGSSEVKFVLYCADLSVCFIPPV